MNLSMKTHQRTNSGTAAETPSGVFAEGTVSRMHGDDHNPEPGPNPAGTYT